MTSQKSNQKEVCEVGEAGKLVFMAFRTVLRCFGAFSMLISSFGVKIPLLRFYRFYLLNWPFRYGTALRCARRAAPLLAYYKLGNAVLLQSLLSPHILFYDNESVTVYHRINRKEKTTFKDNQYPTLGKTFSSIVINCSMSQVPPMGRWHQIIGLFFPPTLPASYS